MELKNLKGGCPERIKMELGLLREYEEARGAVRDEVAKIERGVGGEENGEEERREEAELRRRLEELEGEIVEVDDDLGILRRVVRRIERRAAAAVVGTRRGGEMGWRDGTGDEEVLTRGLGGEDVEGFEGIGDGCGVERVWNEDRLGRSDVVREDEGARECNDSSHRHLSGRTVQSPLRTSLKRARVEVCVPILTPRRKRRLLGTSEVEHEDEDDLVITVISPVEERRGIAVSVFEPMGGSGVTVGRSRAVRSCSIRRSIEFVN
jgi:hypothetical protein